MTLWQIQLMLDQRRTSQRNQSLADSLGSRLAGVYTARRFSLSGSHCSADFTKVSQKRSQR